jgi:hypothetical protein
VAPRVRHAAGRRAEVLLLGLSGAVALGWAVERLVPNPEPAPAAAPGWLALVAAAVVATVASGPDTLNRFHARGAFSWTGLLLMVWAASGLPFDVLTLAGLIGHRAADGTMVESTVYWPGLATRVAALTTAVVLARRALADPHAPPPAQPASWYGYAAFALALPYPVLRIHWALGGTIGLTGVGVAGEGFAPLLLAIPWLLAAGLALVLVAPRPRLSRRLVLAAGWSATLIVAMIGPAAFWALVTALASGSDPGSGGIAGWVFGLFYTSWFLWAIAGGAATRSYQLRTTSARTPA